MRQFTVCQEANRAGNCTLAKQHAVAMARPNKQSGEKKELGVNQPEGTRDQSLMQSEPVSQGRPSQVSSSVKYQRLIVYPFSFPFPFPFSVFASRYSSNTPTHKRQCFGGAESKLANHDTYQCLKCDLCSRSPTIIESNAAVSNLTHLNPCLVHVKLIFRRVEGQSFRPLAFQVHQEPEETNNTQVAACHFLSA